ncbi:hypothetical protein Pcar_3163 [Syntrophotalea carbinolica DSM 2380]|uniref:Uncharacterized protein n=1 Tax=Syntrophotalea carbinolica (strain DSM 2380 / NBRC 103641 / GraBd1) TaxID=338963 RepID=Q0C703_SYNC1|nr:hypothetical protein Pcar_3163 [Syntrophotalea carbinolica DSM 2380]
MKIKTHSILMIISSFAGSFIGSTLAVGLSEELLAEGYPTGLIFFAFVHIGWIIPWLVFKFVFRAKCPKCRSKGRYIWRRERRLHEFICPKCAYTEKAIWTFPSNVS